MEKKIEAYIRPATKEFPWHVVMVSEFKFDTIRQESYWVMKQARKYRLRSDAEAFKARFN